MKKIQGMVISDKVVGTATVKIERWVVHPMYGKRLKRHKKYHADNAIGAKMGDKVTIIQVKPISKTKTWKITEIAK